MLSLLINAYYQRLDFLREMLRINVEIAWYNLMSPVRQLITVNANCIVQIT